jgi:hypothetical protein
LIIAGPLVSHPFIAKNRNGPLEQPYPHSGRGRRYRPGKFRKEGPGIGALAVDVSTDGEQARALMIDDLMVDDLIVEDSIFQNSILADLSPWDTVLRSSVWDRFDPTLTSDKHGLAALQRPSSNSVTAQARNA